ncbi:MAG: RsmB/NOP family class I SAM-dependent RNA methyltransferase, partial [Lachnospiraceae bacterium]|nr:RsmB/NOP family class I SAM-dependent RNA methyltransferase [Lachnospiraceae bacterium]
MRLPEQFKARMEKELGPEYGAFIASYEDTRLYGLRCNLLKSDPKAFCEKMPFLLSKIEFAEAGFYYNDEERPGKHVYHEAGAYYIQEPSAMSAVTELDVKEGDIVLDLCAAPGGKSTQIASYLNGQGLLVTNEINKDRAVILSSNIERMGVRNAVVTSEASDSLARHFPLFFNKILVDAPCSGEGMFRKDETAVSEWSPENVSMCAKRQEEILKNAASMLAPGGTLVYSTCTFSREENEDNIEKFINENPDFELLLIKRLMPHVIKGEGHFVAKLKKKGEFVQ